MRSSGRAIAVSALLVLSAVVLLLSTFAVWIDRVALNTDGFVDASTELIEDDAIRQAVATRAVDELYANVDVETELEDPLPKDVESLSGPLAAGIRQAAYEIVDRALRQPALQRLWSTALEQSHETLVLVLEGDPSTVSTQGGVVSLELEQIIRDAADRIGIGQEIADKLPTDAGRIEILRSDELDTAQDAFQILKALAWLLPILTIVLFAIAVGISRRRRATVRGIGVAVVVVGVIGLVAANLAGNYLVDSLVNDRDTREAAGNAWDILTELVRSSFRWQIALGILFVLAAWLAGPGRQAIAARRAIAPLARERRYAYTGLAVVALVLVATGPLDGVRLLILVLLLGLLTVWIELTRAQTMREFPGAELTAPPFLGEARERMTEWIETRRADLDFGAHRSEGANTPDTPAEHNPRLPQQPPATDLTTRLEHLADLHARGALTDAEYATAKARVLAGE